MATPPDESFKADLFERFGVDRDVYDGIKSLEELREKVAKGDMKESVYKKLEQDFINRKKGRSKSKNRFSVFDSPKQRGKSKKKGGVLRFFKVSNVRRRGSSVISGFGVPDDSNSFPGGSFDSPKPVSAPVVNTQSKLIIEDTLLRLAKNRTGQTKWRPIYVILYDRALVYYSSERHYKKKEKPLRSISFDDQYFINEVEKGFLLQENLGNNGVLDASSKKALVRDHVFLVSNLEEKYYFAAEDEEKKEYWLSMVTAVLKDLRENHQQNQQQLMSARDLTIKQYTDRQRHQTMRNIKLKGEPITQEFIEKEEIKWEAEAKRVARQSVAMKWNEQQRMENANFLNEQERLLKEVDALRQDVEQQRAVNQQLKQENAALKDLRKEAQDRNNMKLMEQQHLQTKMMTLKRMSMIPSAANMAVISGGRDFEAEIAVLQTKLKALESALNVDMSSLDWDGTLDDAEEKMKALIPKLGSGDEKEMQEAQAKFDQWDQIIRNHGDYIMRETNKWKDWEESNASPNLAALAEMKRFVPHTYKNVQEIVTKTNVSMKIAKRIKKNAIFSFFYMPKDKIAKIHDADLLNKYAAQGLDIREMRAVYATLPDEFMNDTKGSKKQWREMIRNRLFELTKKEAAGTLSPPEKLNNAYRDKEIKANVPKNFAPAKKSRPKNNKMANKAKMLQALLENKGSEPPAKSRQPSKPAGNKGKFNPNDPAYAKYKKMMAMNMPEGAIQGAMQRDGVDPAILIKLKGGSASAPIKRDLPQPARSISIVNPMKKANSGQEISHYVSKSNSPVTTDSQVDDSTGDKAPKPRKIVKKAPKRTLRKSMNGRAKTGEIIKRNTRRNTRRQGKKSLNNASNVLSKDADELLEKALMGTNGVKTLKGGHGVGNLEYGQAISKKPTKKAGGKESIQEVLDIIALDGVFDPAEKGLATIKYSLLFDQYKAAGKDPAMLVGLLIKAKRGKKVRYRGDMLFKGIHDQIKITLDNPKA